MFQLSPQRLLLAVLVLQAHFQIRSVDCRRQGRHRDKPHKVHASSHRGTLRHRNIQFPQWISNFFPNFTNEGRNIGASPSASPSSQLPTNQAQNSSLPMQPQPASAPNATSAPLTNGNVPVNQSSTVNASKTAPASSPSNLPLPTTMNNSTSPASVNQSSSNTIKPGNGCSSIRLRREWRKFSRQEQISYINAVKCLATKPSQLIPGGDFRRYDDFENVHSRMRNKIHWIASFLPWHRHFMFLFEQALQKECGYTGNLPRWDWTLDSADMTKSPIWSSDPQVGFGGNGRDFSDNSDGLDAGIVTDGAFANWTLYYPDTHRLQRNYNLPDQYRQPGRSWGSQFFDASAISTVQAQSTYAKFAVALEGTDPASTGPSNPGPHSIIHVIIGGDISPTAYAANEPLFYLHHNNVDYHWWKWQHASGANRLNAYGGQATRGSGRNDAKLTDQLKFLGITPDITVAKTMDTSAFPYCYGYE